MSDQARLRKYGISPDVYRTLYERQCGVCAVCQSAQAGVVDHDHDSGAPRGLLCPRCNLLLGHAKDSPVRLRAAADYLENGGVARHLLGREFPAIAA